MKKHKHEYRIINPRDNEIGSNYVGYCIWCLRIVSVNGYHFAETINFDSNEKT